MPLTRSLARAEFFAVVLIVAALNGLSTRITSSLEGSGPLGAALDLFGVNAVVWFALYAVLKLGVDGNRNGVKPVSRADVAVAGVVLFACLLPTQLPALAALLGGSLYLFATSQKGTATRGIGVIALALTGPLVWGSLVLRLLGPELLAFDAFLGGSLAGYEVTGNVILTPGGEQDLLVGPGCSAFKNVTLVFVLTAALTQLLEIPFDRRMAGWVGVAVAGVIALNGIRLASLAVFPEHFDYLHVGGGMVLFGYATLIIMAMVIGMAIMRRPRPRHAV